MKKLAKKNKDTMRAEYDFSQAKQGVHADRYAACHEVMLLKSRAPQSAKPRNQAASQHTA
jgi:hypothetical protein